MIIKMLNKMQKWLKLVYGANKVKKNHIDT